MSKVFGNLIIIGGAEDKKSECEILKEVIKKTNENGGPLLLIAAATDYPDEVREIYSETFKRLGFDNFKFIDIKDRTGANDRDYAKQIEECGSIFFTGGDQLKITSLIGGTKVYESLKRAYDKGILIVGTSAGASCICSTMIVSGKEEDSPKKCTIKMAPGLDLIQNVIIDQHFAQRGRIGRLFNAVAQNPESLGIGIDENTAVVMEGTSIIRVIGEGAATIVDGKGITCSNISELNPDETLAITDIRVHILPRGYQYDIEYRVPKLAKCDKEETDEDNR